MSNQNNNIPEGFKMTELGPLPKEWEVARMADFVNTVKGKKPADLTQIPGKDYLPYLTAEYFRTFVPTQFVCQQNNGSFITVSKDDIVFIWDGSNAGDVFTGLQGVLASTMIKIVPRADTTYKPYLYFFLKTRFELFTNSLIIEWSH
jgi:type I restriction enzyme S subunit